MASAAGNSLAISILLFVAAPLPAATSYFDLNGGASAFAGDYLTIAYSIENLFHQDILLTVEAQLGERLRGISVGIVKDRIASHALQAGLNLYLREFKYHQGDEGTWLAPGQMSLLDAELNSDLLLRYALKSKGIAGFLAYPLRRSTFRLTYGFEQSTVMPKDPGTLYYFISLGASPRMNTSFLTPSYSYDTRNDAARPSNGTSIFASSQIAGGILGGDVKTAKPVVDVKYYHPSPKWHRNTLAFHLRGEFVPGYGGKEAPPWSRLYLGGDQDIRGFNNFTISPLVFIASEATVPVLNANGMQMVQKVFVNQ